MEIAIKEKLLSPQNFYIMFFNGFGNFLNGILRAKIAMDGDLRVDLGKNRIFFENECKNFKTYIILIFLNLYQIYHIVIIVSERILG